MRFLTIPLNNNVGDPFEALVDSISRKFRNLPASIRCFCVVIGHYFCIVFGMENDTDSLHLLNPFFKFSCFHCFPFRKC